MSTDRAIAVARVFDEFPYLRPRRVGGDPARIKVMPSMEAVVTAAGLPIEWLTVRRNEGNTMEFGAMDLLPGRGGWMGEQEDGRWTYSLTGHSIEQSWAADTVAESDAVAAVAALFEGLVMAMDAAYGCVTPGVWRPRPLYTGTKAKLPGVFWLNYFGPAFVCAHPELATIVGARTLPTGGVLVQTSSEPWQPYEAGIPAWQSPLRAVLGKGAFKWVRPNPALPSIDEHVRASPGTDEMPWIAWQASKAANDRARKHAAARKRLAAASLGRAQPMLADDAVEWSTSFDLDDWREFAGYLSRKLRGELTTTIGKAVISVITTAPVDEEDSITLETQLGAICLGWFIDDEDVVDVYIWGSPQVSDLCNAWLA